MTVRSSICGYIALAIFTLCVQELTVPMQTYAEQGDEKKPPPRPLYIWLVVGAFPAITYGNVSEESWTESTTGGLGPFAELGIRTPPLGQMERNPFLGRLDMGVFGARTSLGRGWYTGVEVRLFLTYDYGYWINYRYFIQLGMIYLRPYFLSRLGITLETRKWIFFITAVPGLFADIRGVIGSMQLGLGRKF